MAQFFSALGQTEKTNEQTFYNNVEDNTVQYVLSPDKTQFPTQQIVVTSGEQLMVVDGQTQQIVIEQPTIAYQGQRIQQTQVQQSLPEVLHQQQNPTQVHIQNQQFAVIQDGGVSNGTQQIFFMEGNASTLEQQVVQQAQATQQPIVLNHQIGQGNTIVRPLTRTVTPTHLLTTVRGAVRQPIVQQRGQIRAGIRPPTVSQLRQINPNQNTIRTSTPQQQQIRQTNPTQTQLRAPSQVQIRQTVQQQQQPQQQIRQGSPLTRTIAQVQFRPTQNVNQQTRQTGSNQVIRTTTVGQVRMMNQTPNRMPSPVQKAPNTGNPRFAGLANIQQQNQQLTQQQQQQKMVNSSDDSDKSMEEQETLSMPDGNVMTVAAYKKFLAEPKSRILTKSNTTTQVAQSSVTAAAAKKRTVTPRPRAPPKKPVVATTTTSSPASQLTLQQQQQVTNDPSRYVMMNQQHMGNNSQSSSFQNQQQNQSTQQTQQIQQMKPSQANYVIQPPKQNQKPQLKRPLPSYIPSSQIQKIIENTPISEEFSDSIRMLVLLENGEQRLITFTLPKEACTIQEILEQVNVPFQANTNIQVTEANCNGINYIVTVGNMPSLGYEEDESSMQSEPQSCPPPPVPSATLTQMATQESPSSSQNEIQIPGSPCSNSQNQIDEAKSTSPEPTKEILPKLMPGMLALCGACGYLSEDFAKCIRCQRKLPDNVKAIQATFRDAANGQKKTMPVLQQSPQFLPSTPILPNKAPTVAKAASPTKKKPTKAKAIEQESVVISSDEEGEEEKTSELSTNLIQKLGASVTISPVTKEPSLTDIQRHTSCKLIGPTLPESDKNSLNISLKFRTIRVGSYRCVPPEKVIFDNEKVIMKVPHPDKLKGVKTITFEKNDVVKVLASFNPALPVIFYYLNLNASKAIRDQLDMTVDGDYYYDPISVVDESFRRITFLPDEISEEEMKVLQAICGLLLEELNAKEANDILIKTCPKEVARASLGLGGAFTEIKTLLQYPPEGRGRITINTEDYVCLAQDQFLNDVIIDFYLKYLVDNLPVERRNKVHVFSTFFYKRLTTKPTKASRKSQPAELDPNLTPAQKRHARVKTWTKSVNLFDKDFIVVPINENAHWFLAIICFPGMDGCETWDGKPYKLQVRSRKKKKPLVEPIPSVSVTPIKQEKVDATIVCEDPSLSDKDEAEGDDSELESDDSEEIPLAPTNISATPDNSTIGDPVAPPTPKGKIEPRPAIKQPCILIFDSLAGANRSRVVATLRDYLTCEYKTKLGKEKNYNKDVIKGCNPKVPQQNNFTDCGLYVLQYVEHFFKQPITDYNMPIKQIQNWFEEITVTKKREDIAILIKTLMREYGKDINLLPDIVFPTINGKLIEHDFDDEEEEEEMPEEDEEDEEFMHHHTDEEFDEKDESMLMADTASKSDALSETASSLELISDEASPIKPSMNNSDDFVVQPVLNPKPDLSEFPRQTNKDTLSILKAKRIIRHKTNGPEMKKLKSDEN